MSYAKENVFFKRQQLAATVETANELLQTIKTENLNNTELSNEDKKLFNDRLKVFNELITAIVNYDIAVKNFEHENQNNGNAEYYRQQLQVARKYVNYLGGDWQTVVWGKISDY